MHRTAVAARFVKVNVSVSDLLAISDQDKLWRPQAKGEDRVRHLTAPSDNCT